MRKALMVILVGGGLAVGGTALASADEIGGGRPPEQSTQRGVDAAQASDLALRQAGGGRVMKVEQTGSGFRVTLMGPSGPQSFTVDGRTGAVGGGQPGGFPGGQPGGGQPGGGQPGGFPGGGPAGNQGQPGAGDQSRSGEYQWSWDFGTNDPNRQGTTPSK